MSKKRRIKRYLNHLNSKLKFGDYFENCFYHPSRVTNRTIYSSDMFGNDIEGVSLVDSSGCSCSMWHCGPTPMTKEMAEKQAEYLKIEGNKYSDEAFKSLTFGENEPKYIMKLWNRIGLRE